MILNVSVVWMSCRHHQFWRRGLHFVVTLASTIWCHFQWVSSIEICFYKFTIPRLLYIFDSPAPSEDKDLQKTINGYKTRNVPHFQKVEPRQIKLGQRASHLNFTTYHVLHQWGLFLPCTLVLKPFVPEEQLFTTIQRDISTAIFHMND